MTNLKKLEKKLHQKAFPTTAKYSVKKYKCLRCGAISMEGTNHWGEIYPRCKGCSWKNPMQPQTAMKCLEKMPKGYKKPEKWKTVKLGELIG